MSVESAKAFCVHLMSDDQFRDLIGAATNSVEIAKIVADHGYSFSQHDLLKTVSELAGKKIEQEKLIEMICEVYEEEIKCAGSNGSSQAVAEWIKGLA